MKNLLLAPLVILAASLPAPARAQAPTFLTQWGTQGGGPGQFNSPVAVAVDAGGRVFVADLGNSRIQVFSSDGTFLSSWGSFGTGPGQFDCPYGIAFDAGGNVYVADENNKRVQMFSPSGAFITQWDAFGAHGVVVVGGLAYATDYWNNCIRVCGGGWYGTQGSGPGQFNGPVGIAADASGHIYVADYNNGRVQELTTGGAFIAQWGVPGSGPGQLTAPFGVAVDAEGNVYVADFYNRVQKFSPGGAFVAQWGVPGSGPGQFNRPTGVAVAADGRIYVSDYGNNYIQAYGAAPVAAIPTTWGRIKALYR